MRRAYSKPKSHSDINITIISLIVIAVIAYNHRVFIYKMAIVGVSIYVISILFLKSRIVYTKFKYKYINDMSNLNIDKMTGLEFEVYVAKLLKQKGYTNIKLTEKYDYGVDIIASKKGTRWGIQVKRYSGIVKADAVRQVVTALKVYNCDKAMVITNSYYSEVAEKLAKSNQVLLVRI